MYCNLSYITDLMFSTNLQGISDSGIRVGKSGASSSESSSKPGTTVFNVLKTPVTVLARNRSKRSAIASAFLPTLLLGRRK